MTEPEVTYTIGDGTPFVIPALGKKLELGTLYDARKEKPFLCKSIWNVQFVKAHQDIVGKADFRCKTAFSPEEVLPYCDLGDEGLLMLKLGVISEGGRAKFLKMKRDSMFEARVFVSYCAQKQVRKIRQGALDTVSYENFTANPDYTHYVAEVVEGGCTVVEFKISCANAEEQERIQGMLAELVKATMPMSEGVSTGTERDPTPDGQIQNLEVNFYGSIERTGINLQDAVQLAERLPEKLASSESILSVKLLPLSTLNPSARRMIRTLDRSLVTQIVDTWRSLELADIEIKDVAQLIVAAKFPHLRGQCKSFAARLGDGRSKFRHCMVCLLPAFKDGKMKFDSTVNQILHGISVAKRQIDIAKRFIMAKKQECSALQFTVLPLFEDGFKDFISTGESFEQAISDEKRCTIVLSLAGMQQSKRFEDQLLKGPGQSDTSNSSEDEEEDWYESTAKVQFLHNSCKAIAKLRSCNVLGQFEAMYAIGTVPKALRHDCGVDKRRKTALGDIIFALHGTLQVITTAIPEPPTIRCSVNKQDVTVLWQKPENDILPATGFRIAYQPLQNADLDEFDQQVGENEPTEYCVINEAFTTKAVLSSLKSYTDYRVSAQTRTKAGFSEFGNSVFLRTEKRPTVASEMITFFLNNSTCLQGSRTASIFKSWESEGGRKGWEMTDDSLFLGFTTSSICRNDEGISVLVVDVVPEFRPEVELGKEEDAKVVMFVGKTGVGKTTEINALVSYLLEGQLSDSHRLMLIDDRGFSQVSSITQYITVYRIRALSGRFPGTVYIIDTPGYGDTGGHKRDKFVTRAVAELFKEIKHINAVLFTSVSNQVRASPGICGVAAHVFELFSRDVRGCLRTILTYSDAGEAPAVAVLQSLGWPVENGVIEVNNAAFKVTNRETENLKRWWNLSMSGQREIAQMLRGMPPVPTEKSAQVADKRMTLNEMCELAERKVYRTANHSQQLLANMNALADAVGASPKDKVAVTVKDIQEEDVPEGKHTTLCRTCNFTCHEICVYGNDQDKQRCSAMSSDGRCMQCPKKCNWNEHTNAKFILRPTSRTEYVVPNDLIKIWNENTNTLEGALIDALDSFLSLQEELLVDIKKLHALTLELEGIALKHDPAALLRYMEELIITAKARGAPPEQLQALHSAKNVLKISSEVARCRAVPADTQVLMDVVSDVRKEMQRRNALVPVERASEEDRDSLLYNSIWSRLPRSIQQMSGVPATLREKNLLRGGAKFNENLRAVIKLISSLLKHGAIHSVGGNSI